MHLMHLKHAGSIADIIERTHRQPGEGKMLIFVTSPLSCRVGWRPDFGCNLGPAGDLCAFEFPQCRGCHKAPERARPEAGDPMDSVIWRGWINGFAQTEREPDALVTMLLDAPAHFATLSKTVELQGMTE
jgi:hypothetical protein